MDSPTMGPLAMVENVEENRWQNAMFEGPNNNGQNFNSGNYADWGNAPFSESRRRPSGGMRGKPHHHSKRGHQQAAYERGPAPVSPQWQPQPPPPPPPSQPYAGFQEPAGPVSVNLSGLPYALCRQNFLEAMLDQAGLGDEIKGCVLGQETGKAVIYLASYNSALKCVQHFGGRRWDQAGAPVHAEVAQGEGPPSTGKPTAKLATERGQKLNDTTNNQEQMNMPSPALGFVAGPGAWAMPHPMLPIMAVQDYQGSDFSRTNGGNKSPSGSGSDSPKTTRWADLDDEEKDLSEGPSFEGSTSAGSSGRNRDESFSFGCDVDTDDGF